MDVKPALFKADFFPGDFTIKYEPRPSELDNFTWSKIKINIQQQDQDTVTNFEECKEACPNSMPECLDACESQYNTVAEEEASSHKCAADPRFDASRDPAHEHRSSGKEFGIACGTHRLIKAGNGNPTPIAWTETYTSLKQGVVNGIHVQPLWTYLFKMHEEIFKI